MTDNDNNNNENETEDKYELKQKFNKLSQSEISSLEEEKDFGDSDEDWDFDFSMYERDEKEEVEHQMQQKLSDKPSCMINLFRKKFNDYENDNERIHELRKKITSCSINVEARVQDKQQLWKLYACLSEFWDLLSPFTGRLQFDEINFRKKRVYNLLRKHKGGIIEERVFNNLLYYKKILYKHAQWLGFGFTIERVGSYRSAAESKIIQ